MLIIATRMIMNVLVKTYLKQKCINEYATDDFNAIFFYDISFSCAMHQEPMDDLNIKYLCRLLALLNHVNMLATILVV